MNRRQNRGERMRDADQLKETAAAIAGLEAGIRLAQILGYERQEEELRRRLGAETHRRSDDHKQYSWRYQVWRD